MDREHFFIRIADMTMEIQCNYPYTRNFCKDYIVHEEKADIAVSVTKEDVEEWRTRFQDEREGYVESLCLHQKIAEQLPFYDRFLFHGAVITFRDQGFVFTAPSGTGKSTHIRLWRKYLGEAVDIVNGDKPIMAVEDEKNGKDKVFVRAFGTPWSGKECWQKNRSNRLNGICFLRQGKENTIRRLLPKESLEMLFHQVFLMNDAAFVGRTMELLDKMVTSIPLYLLECDMSKEAVKCSFEAMTGLSYEKNKKE